MALYDHLSLPNRSVSLYNRRVPNHSQHSLSSSSSPLAARRHMLLQPPGRHQAPRPSTLITHRYISQRKHPRPLTFPRATRVLPPCLSPAPSCPMSARLSPFPSRLRERASSPLTPPPQICFDFVDFTPPSPISPTSLSPWYRSPTHGAGAGGCDCTCCHQQLSQTSEFSLMRECGCGLCQCATPSPQEGSLWYMSDFVSDNCSLGNISELGSSPMSNRRGIGKAASVIGTTCHPTVPVRPVPHYRLPCSCM